VLASLGCGNPTAVADLHEDEIVLDLGSGGGLDVIVEARHVGDSGIVAADDLSEEEAGNEAPSRAGHAGDVMTHRIVVGVDGS
jgi:cyclopropane fatty-acyl-phospholipid synthase-like methyltransferase